MGVPRKDGFGMVYLVMGILYGLIVLVCGALMFGVCEGMPAYLRLESETEKLPSLDERFGRSVQAQAETQEGGSGALQGGLQLEKDSRVAGKIFWVVPGQGSYMVHQLKQARWRDLGAVVMVFVLLGDLYRRSERRFAK